METSGIVASITGALAGLGSLASVYQRRSHRLRAEIEANHLLAGKFPDSSSERAILDAYTHALIDSYVRKGAGQLGSRRSWGEVITTLIAAVAFAAGATLVEPQWAQIVLWILAGFCGVAVLGQFSPPRDGRRTEEKSKEKSQPSAVTAVPEDPAASAGRVLG